MKKLDRCEYELTFICKDDDDLQDQIDELHREMFQEADLRNCFVEADFYEKSTDRSF